MEYHFANRVERMEASGIRKLLKITTDPRLISFGAGSPAKNLFPIEELKKANDFVYSDQTRSAFQYSRSEGFEPLREWITDRHNRLNQTNYTKENVLITNGSQQGLDLVGKIFLNKGDIVLCERPTYVSALSAFKSYECEFIDVKTDSEGMIINEVETLIAQHNNIKLIYLIPNFQNPTGTTWSLERRKALAEIAAKNEIVILEDDPYRELLFEGNPIPSISKFDQNHNVITLGSFSKSLCPGLRVGWIIAYEQVLEKLVYAKQATDLQSNEIVQQQIYHYLEKYDFDDRLVKMREEYAHRCDIAYQAIVNSFPTKISCVKPKGGFFLWLTLPEEWNAMELLPEAIKKGVAYVPGDCFYATNPRQNNARLNFSSITEQDLIHGIKLLGSLFHEFYD